MDSRPFLSSSYRNLFQEALNLLRNYYPENEASAFAKRWLQDRFFLIHNKTFSPLFLDEIPADLSLWHKDLEQIATGKPLQYVLQTAFFDNLTLHVTPDVLIPRPETEQLVSLIHQHNPQITTNFSILDVCTGSGCIAIALKKRLPNAQVLALDISPEALAIAQMNAEMHHAPITFYHKDLFKTLPLDFQHLDLIVSNPPYIPENEYLQLPHHIIHFEPAIALVSTPNPIQFYEKIIFNAKHWLKPHGQLWCEIHPNFLTQLQNLLLSNGFQNIQFLKDFADKSRFLFAFKGN